MAKSRCGRPSRRLRLAVCSVVLCAWLFTERSSAVSDFIERVPLRRSNYNHELETLGPETFKARPHVYPQLQRKKKEGVNPADDSLPALSLVSEQQQASLPRGPPGFRETSFLEVGSEAARKGAVHAARLAIKLAGRQPATAQGALPSALRPSAHGAAAAPLSVQQKALPSRTSELLSKAREEKETPVSPLRGSLVRRGSGLTGARRAGIDKLAQMYKEDAEARKQPVSPAPGGLAAKEKPAHPSPAAAAAAALPKAAAPGVETPQAKKHLTEILAARGITGRQPSIGLAARRMQQEKEAKGIEEEALKAKRIREEQEARKKKEEEEEKKKTEREEEPTAAAAAAAAKKKEAAAGLSKLLGRKPGKKAILPELEEDERMRRKDRELRELKKSSEEELRKEAEEIFREINKKAKDSQKEPVQPPLPDLVKRVFVTEKAGEEEKLSVDPRIPKQDIEKALSAMQQQAKQYESKFNYFPKGTMKIQSAKYDDPKGGCHTMASNWSACSVGCGSGDRMRFTVARSGTTCVRTANSEHCVSSLTCKNGAEFFQKAAHVKGPSDEQAEEYGRNISHNLALRDVDNKVCIEFDTNLTQRVYTETGLLGAAGTGRRIRLIKKYDSEKKSCVLSQEDVYVTRTQMWTMDEFKEIMLEGHNSIRRLHSVPLLQWNPLISANVIKYLQNQSKNHGCRMEHSPADSRLLPGIKEPLGENLLIACSNGQVPKDAPDSWASERYCYRYGNVGNPCTGMLGPLCSVESHASGLMTGHYTQVVWSGSKEIGCGYTVCDRHCSGDRPMILIGCQYSPAGNIVKEKPYDMKIAKSLQKQIPNILPEAPSDPEAVAKCQAFRSEMQQKNPKKVVLD